MEIRMRDDGRSVLELVLDGERIGRIDYFLLDGLNDAPTARVGVHTVVDPAHEGLGAGGRLAVEFYRAAAEADQVAVPLCPYLKDWSDRHPDLAPAVGPALVERAEDYVKGHPSLW